MLLGIFRWTISCAETCSRYCIRARKEFPCATIKMRLPALSAGAMDSFQSGTTRATALQRGRRAIVAAPPLQHLCSAVTRGRLILIQAGERAIVTLVQPPAMNDRYIHLRQFVLDMPERADRALEYRGIRNIKMVAKRL